MLYVNNQPSSNLEGYLAAAATGVPLVQHCRIDVTLKPEEAAAVDRNARRVICVSQGVADSLVAQGVGPERCVVVHNAIDGRQASARSGRRCLDVAPEHGRDRQRRFADSAQGQRPLAARRRRRVRAQCRFPSGCCWSGTARNVRRWKR
ncbi:MAG: glycosyltransferase [Comamonadaceae bacterium]|nr:glycosyltransferase [Comamonadaceae bacterium]